MKRFRVHVSVPDIQASIRFYESVFGQAQAVSCCYASAGAACCA
ncbi:MAG: hypothetical protein RL030_1431 [Pseudomonadota bacterium]|jgi:predicted enzyme related to lactoylglutathione lyase